MIDKRNIVAGLVFLAMLGLTVTVAGAFALRIVVLKTMTTGAPVEVDEEPPAVSAKIAYYVSPTATVAVAAATVPPTLTRKPTVSQVQASPSGGLAPGAPPTGPAATSVQTQPVRAATVVPTRAPTAARAEARVVTATLAPTTAPPVSVSVGESYGMLAVASPPTDRPAERQADLNLSLRGQVPVSTTLGLIVYEGDTDGGAPQLVGLFSDRRTPMFTSAWRVYDWNWECDCRGVLLTDPEVTLVGMRTTPGEVIHLPGAGQQVGNGFQGLVLYADEGRIAVKYTRTDNVKHGYTIHVESISVDSSLLTLYRQANSAGRAQLPALRAGQAFGKATGNEIRVAIRDTGTFMDPRSRKDWWTGR